MQRLLFKSPDLYVLNIEILLFREHGVPKCFTGMTPAVVEISVQPQAKLTAERRENSLKQGSQKLFLQVATFSEASILGN